MSIPYDATCNQCRYYAERTDPETGQGLSWGDCLGLPPRVYGAVWAVTPHGSQHLKPEQHDPGVADLRPPCSLFEARAVEVPSDVPTEAPTIGSAAAVARLLSREPDLDAYTFMHSYDASTGTHTVQCEQLLGAIGQGDTRDLAFIDGKEALRAALAFKKDHPE